MILMGILFYIFAVTGSILFANIVPEYFGTLQLSLLTLFQVMTLDSWSSGILRPLLQEVPWAWVYFVSFVLLGTFIVFNLFIGVIVNNVDKVNQLESGNTAEETKDEIHSLRKEIAEIKQLLKKRARSRQVDVAFRLVTINDLRKLYEDDL